MPGDNLDKAIHFGKATVIISWQQINGTFHIQAPFIFMQNLQFWS